jgi:hypothetical protein
MRRSKMHAKSQTQRRPRLPKIDWFLKFDLHKRLLECGAEEAESIGVDAMGNLYLGGELVKDRSVSLAEGIDWLIRIEPMADSWDGTYTKFLKVIRARLKAFYGAPSEA